MKIVRLTILLASLALLSGCSILAGAGVAVADSDREPEPYAEEPPGESGANPDLEAETLEWATSQESRIDYRWVTLGSNWTVDRQTDPAGNEQIVGKRALVWVGGPVGEANDTGDSQPGDCAYLLVVAYQEHMGGGDYGSTRMWWSEEWLPNYRKLRCEDPDQLAAATPEEQEPGPMLEATSAEE